MLFSLASKHPLGNHQLGTASTCLASTIALRLGTLSQAAGYNLALKQYTTAVQFVIFADCGQTVRGPETLNLSISTDSKCPCCFQQGRMATLVEMPHDQEDRKPLSWRLTRCASALMHI